MAFLLGLFLLVAASLQPDLLTAQTISKEVCLSCHGVQGLEKTKKGKPVSLFLDRDRYSQSIHGAFECNACHADISQVPHPAELKPVQCSQCHADAFQVYAQSVHGKASAKGDGDAAKCADCHGGHDILRAKDPESRVYPLNLPRTCGACHGDPELAKRHGISVANAYQLYMDSIHGRALTKSGLLVSANCSSCHGSHSVLPATDPKSSVHRNNVPATCGQCHAGVLKIWATSIHGQLAHGGNVKAPVCIDCHTSHEIRRVEMDAWKLEVVRECGSCHVESLRSYRDTFHGQVTALGFTRVARCSDCHGSHDILPMSDPRSSVAPGRIVPTCQKCHPSANVSFAKYDPHANPDDKRRNPSLYYSARFMTWLLASVFIFFGVHTVLWFVRSLVERRRQSLEQRANDRPSSPGNRDPNREEKDG